MALPAAPEVVVLSDQVVVYPAARPAPRVVRLAVSLNSGYTFAQYVLARELDGAWRLRGQIPADAIVIAEVETEEGVTVTSIPRLPASYRPHARPYAPVQSTETGVTSSIFRPSLPAGPRHRIARR